MSGRSVRVAGSASATVLLAVAGFQLALAAGAPLGRAAWGGTTAHPPAGLRAGSALAAVVLVGFAAVVARRAGLTVPAPVPERRLGAACWVITGLLALNTAGNLASTSPVERAVMAPTTAVLTVLVGIVARGPRTRPSRDAVPAQS